MRKLSIIYYLALHSYGATRQALLDHIEDKGFNRRSERTLYRDIRELRMIGANIEYKEGRYYLLDELIFARRYDMNRPTHIIWKAMGGPSLEGYEEIRERTTCCICNNKISEGYKRKDIVSRDFNDFDYFSSSPLICLPCAFCIRTPMLRRTSFIATQDKFIPLKRDELEEYLFSPPDPPFVFCITSSYKKHLSFKAEVNFSSDIFSIRYDDNNILFSRKEMRGYYNILEELYEIFSKTEIKIGNYSQARILKFGLERWRTLEYIIKEIRGALPFELLLYVLNRSKSNERDKNNILSEGQ